METKPADTSHDINIREYRPKDLIVSEADPCDRFYVILKGEVEIFQNKKSIRVLKEGDIFGLENFYLNHPYTTAAYCLSAARIATYPAKLIRDIIYNRPQLTEKILQSVMTQLEQTTQIAEEFIPRENVVDITITELVFHDGDVIIEENTSGCDIYQLIESENGLLVTKDGIEIGTISKPGEYFGELSALLKHKRTATVRSRGRSVVKVFSGDNLEVILTTYPHLAKAIIDTLANRLIAANAMIADRGTGAGS
jgi:CRP-like cAMP-binding protein